MARIIVTTGPAGARGATPPPARTEVLLDERVESFHLCEGNAAQQLIERIAWAVNDAEEVEHSP